MSIFALLHIGKAGLQTELSSDVRSMSIEVFQLFVNDEVIERIVTETDRYVAQSFLSENLSRKQAKKHRLHKWVDTTAHELYFFRTVALDGVGQIWINRRVLVNGATSVELCCIERHVTQQVSTAVIVFLFQR